MIDTLSKFVGSKGSPDSSFPLESFGVLDLDLSRLLDFPKIRLSLLSPLKQNSNFLINNKQKLQALPSPVPFSAVRASISILPFPRFASAISRPAPTFS